MLKLLILSGLLISQSSLAQFEELTEQNLKFIKKSINENDKSGDPYIEQSDGRSSPKKSSRSKPEIIKPRSSITNEEQVKLEDTLQELYSECKSKKLTDSCDRYNKLEKEYSSKFNDSFIPLEPLTSPVSTNMDTCVWSSDLPRRVIEIPGCSLNVKSKACVGYVICENKEGVKFVRMSTCSAQNCGDTDAVSCTKEKGYGSKNMGDFNTSSKKVDEILLNPKSSRK